MEGEQVEFSDAILQNMTDTARLAKIYKLNGTGTWSALLKEEREAVTQKELEVLSLGAMALRGATN